MELKVKKLHPEAKLPTRADTGSNGYDLYAVDDVFIPVGETRVISTGISIEIEEKIGNKILTMEEYNDAEILPIFKIEDRSSMAAKGLRTGAGVVDFSYRGEIKVVMHNLNNDEIHRDTDGWPKGYKIKKGDKIAQGVIYTTMVPPIKEADALSDSERGNRGFGSSGS